MEFDEYEGIYLFPQILFFFYNYIYSFFLKFENDKIIVILKSNWECEITVFLENVAG